MDRVQTPVLLSVSASVGFSLHCPRIALDHFAPFVPEKLLLLGGGCLALGLQKAIMLGRAANTWTSCLAGERTNPSESPCLELAPPRFHSRPKRAVSGP